MSLFFKLLFCIGAQLINNVVIGSDEQQRTQPNKYIYPVFPKPPPPGLCFSFLSQNQISQKPNLPPRASTPQPQPSLPDFPYVSASSDLTITNDCQGGLESQHFRPFHPCRQLGEDSCEVQATHGNYTHFSIPLLSQPPSFLLWLLSWGLPDPLAASTVCLTQA